MRYARSAHWNKVFQQLYQAGTDLDWGNQWTNTFIETFRSNSIKRVLDLGCGTGNDVVRLADAGFHVMGLDYSVEALKQASLKQSTPPHFVLADMAQPLPFATSSFDAVMSNVSVHMFSDSITRAIFSDIWRIVRPNGLFVFHLNAIEDRPLRMKWKPVIKEIEPNYVLEQDGQTMHFFSETYLRELLDSWSTTTLEPVDILHHDTQQPFKRVWCGIAQK